MNQDKQSKTTQTQQYTVHSITNAPHIDNVLAGIGTLVAIVGRAHFEFGQEHAAHAFVAFELGDGMTAVEFHAVARHPRRVVIVFGQVSLAACGVEGLRFGHQGLADGTVRTNVGGGRESGGGHEGGAGNGEEELHRHGCCIFVAVCYKMSWKKVSGGSVWPKLNLLGLVVVVVVGLAHCNACFALGKWLA